MARELLRNVGNTTSRRSVQSCASKRIDDWWQPWKPEPEPHAAKPSLVPNEIWRSYLNKLINRLDPK
jgi:hypothetical protein